MVDYKIVRSNRKSVAIYVTRDAKVEVRAPFDYPAEKIEASVRDKQAWIAEKLALHEERLAKKESFSLFYGGTALLFGEEVSLTERAGQSFGYDGECFYFPPGLAEEQIRDCLIQVYKSIAKNYFTGRVLHFAEIMGVMPCAVKVTSAKTSWGSCSSRDSINFSWRLVMAEKELIDYVVVHELAHVREKNHSAAFWAEVGKVLPDYAVLREGLKGLARRLIEEVWE